MSLYNYLSSIDDIIVEIGKEMSKDELSKAKKLFKSAEFNPHALLPLLAVTAEYISKSPKARATFISKQQNSEAIRFYAVYILSRASKATEISEDIVVKVGVSYRGFAASVATLSQDLSHEDFCLHALHLLDEYC